MNTGFSTQEITRMLGVSPARLRAYVKAGLLCPQRGQSGELRFSFQDLLLLRTAEGLITDRLPPRRVRDELRKLRKRLPTERPLTGVNLRADGGHVVVRDGRTAWRADSGQGLLAFGATEGEVSVAWPAAAGDPTSPISSFRQRLVPPADRAALEVGVGADGAHAADGTPSEADAAGGGPAPLQPNADDFYQLGCSLEEEAPEAARVAYLNVLIQEPDHADAHVNLGRLMHEAGDLQFAEDHYRAALRVRPNDATACFNLGVVLEDRGRPDAALEMYDAALQVDSSHADAHFNAARLHDIAGRYESALRHLREYRNLTSI